MTIRAKKSLGQHFLRSKWALGSIVEAADVRDGDTVLEIGPGEGALTQALLFAGARVVAVEADRRCILALKERFAEALRVQHLILIEGDIRNKAVAKSLFRESALGDAPYKLVANIPYYLTGMLFRLFLEELRQPQTLVFLVQKEVADQLVAQDGKEGMLSLSVKVYGDPELIAKVGRGEFSPPPKVDSAIIRVANISRMRLKGLRERDYFRILKAGLGAKRKMLLGNLARGLAISKEKLTQTFTALSIDTEIRGEDLSAAQWLTLAQALKPPRR